jgi:hypothetical protein
MTIIIIIGDPALVHRLLDPLDMLETSGNDPPPSEPDYEHLLPNL